MTLHKVFVVSFLYINPSPLLMLFISWYSLFSAFEFFFRFFHSFSDIMDGGFLRILCRVPAPRAPLGSRWSSLLQGRTRLIVGHVPIVFGPYQVSDNSFNGGLVTQHGKDKAAGDEDVVELAASDESTAASSDMGGVLSARSVVGVAEGNPAESRVPGVAGGNPVEFGVPGVAVEGVPDSAMSEGVDP